MKSTIFLYASLLAGTVYVLFFREEKPLSQEAIEDVSKGLSIGLLFMVGVAHSAATWIHSVEEKVDRLKAELERLKR